MIRQGIESDKNDEEPLLLRQIASRYTWSNKKNYQPPLVSGTSPNEGLKSSSIKQNFIPPNYIWTHTK